MAIFAAVPFNLTNGSLADATQVMADFNQIVANGNANAAPLASPAFSGTVTMPDASTWAGTGIANLVSLGVNRASPGTGIVDITGTYRISGTVQATGAAGQLPGTAANDSASAGNVGEYKSTVVLIGGAVNIPLSTNVVQVAVVALTAGDWDVWGEVYFAVTGSNTVQGIAISPNSASMPGAPGDGVSQNQLSIGGGGNMNWSPMELSPCRVSIAGNTNYFLNATATFGSGATSVYGKIAARRVR